MLFVMVSSSAFYHFKAPVGEQFLEEKKQHGKARYRTGLLE